MVDGKRKDEKEKNEKSYQMGQDQKEQQDGKTESQTLL